MFDIKQICTIPPPYGGVTIYVDRLIRKLTSEGYTVGGYYSYNCINEKVCNSIMFDEWKWMETSKFPFKIWKYIWETRNYRVVHSHFSLEGMIYLWTLKTLCRKKIIVTVHNSMVSNYFQDTNIINRFFLKRMLKSDVEWITVSEEAREQMLQFPVKIKNVISVIPAYIPSVRSKSSPLSSDMLRYISEHKKNIVFYGHSFMLNRGVDVYGFETALMVYEYITKSHTSVGLLICLAEDKDIEKIKQLHEIAKSLNIDDKIYWQIGAIDNMKELWRAIDIYFRPTSTDGDSVAVREVLEEGAIVVASDVVSRPDGVVIYSYGSVNDAVRKIEESFNKERRKATPNMRFYNQMKAIYDKILEK